MRTLVLCVPWLALSLVLWYVLGCVVLASVDKDERLFQWARSGPSPWCFPTVVMLWPVVTWRWLKDEL